MTSSATDAPGLRELRRRETERRIVRHTLRLTADRGFDGFTVQELAEAVGISRRTFFNYFPSKETPCWATRTTGCHRPHWRSSWPAGPTDRCCPT